MTRKDRPPQTRDVSEFVGEAIAKFDWNSGGSHTNKLLSIRKTNEGFRVTFAPDGTADKTYLIAFANGEQAAAGESPEISVKSLPPSVVSTIPQCGDTAVDPKLKEIRVTFSKDMITEKMWSICQISKENFPESAGEIHYLADKRTCVFPVKLQPGKTYVLWFNRAQFNAFRDTGNNSAVPYQLVFETRK
jgi:RNA polymerase sigma-70 factor (ECF subfamily)